MTKNELRKFGLILAVGISLIFGLLLPWLFESERSLLPFYVSGIIVIWSIVHANTLIFLYKPWMFIGHILGYINTRIILGIVFFLVFTPMAIVRKLLMKDSMQRKIDKNAGTYWQKSMQQEKEHMERSY